MSMKKKAAETPESPGGEELIAKAYELFEEYRNAYEPEWRRLDRCERLYLGRHWEDMKRVY